MDQSGYWKLFESTGQIDDYLHYKQRDGCVRDGAPKEKSDADHNDGAGAAGDQNR